ncbi:transposase [Propionibacterium acidifaciens]|uniref:transposase n=1 Tax=Propionibacterium acidifaciens TaxID=556499 RepID=UPI0028DC1060|nr:transposase [Propionibacterium acidifaciens]
MCSAPTGGAGNQNAAKPARVRKEELKAILARPPSRTGIHAEFWDVPAIRDVVKILFDVEYQADSSYRLLLRLCGPSLEPPGPVRRAPRRESRHQTHDRSENPSQSPVGRRLGGLHRRRGPLGARGRDPPHAAPKRGQRTRLSVDRQRTSQSFFGALSLTGKRVTLYPIEGNQNTEQTILAPGRLQRETEAGKIAVVPDKARFHHAKALTALYEPGRLLERIMPIHPPPYAPDHNPAGHVRNTARNNTTTIQHETPEETLGASVPHTTEPTVDHDSEHLPPRETRNDFVS